MCAREANRDLQMFNVALKTNSLFIVLKHATISGLLVIRLFGGFDGTLPWNLQKNMFVGSGGFVSGPLVVPQLTRNLKNQVSKWVSKNKI